MVLNGPGYPAHRFARFQHDGDDSGTGDELVRGGQPRGPRPDNHSLLLTHVVFISWYRSAHSRQLHLREGG